MRGNHGNSVNANRTYRPNVSVTLGLADDNTRLKLEFSPIMPRLQKDQVAKLIQILAAYEAKMALVPI